MAICQVCIHPVFLSIVIKLICNCRRQKNAPKYPYPRPLTNDDELLSMNELPGLAWSRASVYDFWSISLAAVETSETPSGKLGWIRDDSESVWFNALYSVALSLIRQFAVICVDAPAANIACVALRDLLRSVPTFKGGFEELTLARKSLILSDDSPADLSQINLGVHDYESDSEVALPPHNETAGSSPPGTPPPSARACAAFVDVATKNKVMYKQLARKEEAKIQKHRAQETVELLRDKEFAPRGFKLDRQRAPPLAPEVADAIGLRYGRLSLRAKTNFHADQLKVEIARLKMLTSQGCRRINEMEQELKYIQSLEVARAKEASILKAVRDQQRTIRHQVRARTEALEEPITVEDSDDDALQEWSVENPDLMPSVESSGNKPSSVPRPIPTPGAATNQAGSPSMGPTNVDAGGSGGENPVAVDSVVGTEGTGESNSDAKVGLEVQPNTTTTAPVSHRPTTATGTLVSAFPVPVSVRRQLAPVCGSRPPLSRAQLPSCVPRAESVVSSVKPFEDTQDVSMYEGFLAADDSDDD